MTRPASAFGETWGRSVADYQGEPVCPSCGSGYPIFRGASPVTYVFADTHCAPCANYWKDTTHV